MLGLVVVEHGSKVAHVEHLPGHPAFYDVVVSIGGRSGDLR
jgi:hypothetical protein